MKLRNIAFATAIAGVVTTSVSTDVFAGASVTNSTTNRYGHVTSDLQVDSVKLVNGHQYNYSEALKMESNGPGFAYSSVNFNGGLTGSAYADNVPNNPDPVAIGAYSSQIEVVNFSETTFVNLDEMFRGTESTTEHTVSTDSF